MACVGPRIIMGIDPGTNYTGYGFLEADGSDVRCIVMGHIDLVKLKDPYSKLRHIFTRVSALIEEYGPDEVALESPFFGENVQSMLKLGRAQGVAMAAALVRGLQVYEYAPRLIKQSITGHGGASKEQVAALLKSILKVDYEIKKLDATDGLAVALCHHFQTSSPIPRVAAKKPSRGKSASWETFLAQNPDRELRQKKSAGGAKASAGVLSPSEDKTKSDK